MTSSMHPVCQLVRNYLHLMTQPLETSHLAWGLTTPTSIYAVTANLSVQRANT